MRAISPGVVVATVVTLFGCGDGNKGSSPAPTGPDKPAPATSDHVTPVPLPVLATLPEASRFVVGANLARLRDSRLVSRALAEMVARDPDLSERLGKILAACELDPWQAVDRVMLGLGAEPDQTVMVATGKLDEATIASCLGRAMTELGGGMVSKIGADGRTLYRAEVGERAIWLGFAAPGIVAVSSAQAWLGQALGDGAKVSANPVLAPLLERSHRDAGIWLIGAMPAAIGQGLVAAAGGELTAAPLAFTGHIELDPGLSAELGLVMASEEDAKLAASKAIPQLAMSSLVAQRYSLGPMVNKIEVTAEGAILYLRISLTAAEVDDALAGVDQMVDREGGAEQDTSVQNPE